MQIRGRKIELFKLLYLIAYYGFAYWLPTSYTPIVGRVSRLARLFLCRHIFMKCGVNVNIERKANFGSGLEIEIGDESALGINCTLPSNTKIGKYVMMGANCFIFAENHRYDRTDIPMCKQGFSQKKTTIIEDDVWIGRDVKMTPGRVVKKGTIVACGCVLTKDFPEYSVIGGNPSKLIKKRNN